MATELIEALDEIELTFNEKLEQALHARDGALLVELEDEKRRSHAQDYADQVSDLRDREAEIRLEREAAQSEKRSYEAQLEIALQEWRKAAEAAHDRQEELGLLQIRLGILDLKFDSLREESKENDQVLRELLGGK